jgi:RHS repeat-associated protein
MIWPETIMVEAGINYLPVGKRVKSIFNGSTTTYFVGAHYEVTGSTVTKYYYAGAQRIAMRTNGALSYLLGDHLGSASLMTNASGNVISDLRYKAWGEVRFASGNMPTKYTYTGQYSDSYINLLWYGSRHYDPYLNQFTQPDTIVPDQYNSQDWNRYSYARNNPLRYTDPDGHFPIIPIIALVGIFFIFNGTSDSYQPNLSTAELESRQTSVEIGTGITLSALSLQAPIVEAISNLYDCATGYCDPSLMLPGSASIYADSADELGDTIITVRHYTDEGTSLKITESGELFENTYVTLPSQISPRSGHLQIEELLEIEPGRGSTYTDFEVPTSNLKVPENGLTTSGDAWQRQLINRMTFPTFQWHRPPGRPRYR